MYEVVSPVGIPSAREISQPISGLDLNGKKLGLVRIPFPNGDILLDALAGLLEERFNALETLKLPSGTGLNWGDYPDQTLTGIITESGIDAAIVGVGC